MPNDQATADQVYLDAVATALAGEQPGDCTNRLKEVLACGVDADARIFAKCARCRGCRPEVGRILKWPELCTRCADYMESDYRGAVDYQAGLERHPLRLLAENPNVPRLVVRGQVVEVWPRTEDEGWWIRPGQQVPLCSGVAMRAQDIAQA